MAEAGLVALLIGAILVGVGILVLIVSFFSESQRKIASLGLKIQLIGIVSLLVGFTFCSTM